MKESDFIRYASIRGYNDYIVYEDGSVFSLKNKEFLKPWIDEKGYNIVTLSSNNKKKHFRVHRLVATYFVINPENKPDVNHIDENKNNNNYNNLEWVTKEENNLYGTRSLRSGLSRIGNPKICKKVRQYSLDDTFIKEYNSITEAEKITGINNIAYCCQGKRDTAGGYVWRYANEICTN